MSTRGGVSAFGVVHKSEYEPGKFRPVTEMDANERYMTRATAWNGPRRRRGNPSPSAARHNLASVYGKHGYSMRHGEFGEITNPREKLSAAAKLKDDFNQSHHEPSAVHPNIAYGRSVPPKLRAQMDQHIDAKAAGKLHHVVVFHHDPNINRHILAAAVPAHTTTGGRGHVVLGQPFEAGAKNPKGNRANLRGIVNHELAHAGIKRSPRQVINPTSNIGEEARADAKSGANVYTKNRAVPGKGATRFLRAVGNATDFHIPGVDQAERYHHVREKVKAAGSRGPRSLRISRGGLIGAGATAAVAGGTYALYRHNAQNREK